VRRDGDKLVSKHKQVLSLLARSYFRSNIQSMSGYVPGEQPQTDGFIKLNTNENPYPPSPAVAVAVNEALRRGLRKYPDPMAGAFRRQASELLGVPPDWI